MRNLVTPFQAAQVDTPKPPDFGSLALLVGEWQGKDPERKPMTASHQWASGGTRLVETLTMAEKPAMTTMYRADKGTAKTLAFNFVDATNLAKPTDAHMHNMSFRFQDRFSQEWVLNKDGKERPYRLKFVCVNERTYRLPHHKGGEDHGNQTI